MNSQFDKETRVWKGIRAPWPFPSDAYVNELVINGLRKSPGRIVQVSADDDLVSTSEELLLKIIRIAQNLTQVGIKSEDVIAVICSNSLDLMAITNGIIQIGAIINPMSVDHSAADLVNMFKQTKPKLVICDFQVTEKVREVLKELGSDAPVYTTWEKVEGVKFAEDLYRPTGIEDQYQPPKFKDPNTKIMAILTSSGSSGPGKGVCMSQSFFLKIQAMELGRTFSFSPIIWGSAFSSLIMTPITSEVRVVTRRPFSPEVFIDIATRRKVTHFMLNPPTLTMLLQSPLVEDMDKSHIVMIMALGGIMLEPLRARLKAVFPKVHFMAFYGLTEVSCSMIFPGYPFEDLNAGFVCPNHEMKVVDDDGKALLPGEVGEFLTKFSICPFLGYYNNPQATKDAVDDEGFVKTGDVGYINEQGFVYVIDRKKEIFKYRGHQINPAEIENIINEIESVEFVSVVPIPNPETYNLAAAVIQKKEGFEKLTEREVIDFVAGRMPVYKQLHGGVYFVDKLPTTATHKILKREAKNIAIARHSEKKKL